MLDENKAIEDYKNEGVDLDELNEEQPAEQPEETKEEPKEEPKDDEPQGDTPKIEKDEEETPNEPLKDEKVKRSIYDEYKDKKKELRSEKELREQAERERDELRQRLEALQNADTPQEKQNAQDDIEAFAQEINADPQALKRMRDLFLKDVEGKMPEGFDKFLEWQKTHGQEIEQQMFEREFKSSLPAIKELVPTASDDEFDAIKAKLDELSHTKEYHDKPLDYIAFKERDTLKTLVSPKKRGMESKGRSDTEKETFEFDPNADYSKMSPKEQEKWEEAYRKMTQDSGISEDAHGRKVML